VGSGGGGQGYCGECTSDSDCFFRQDGTFSIDARCDAFGCCTSGTIFAT
jgi:hypothetical protein